VVATLVAVMVVGCSDRASKAWEPTMTNPAEKTVKVGKPMFVEDMADDDVIVSVNGVKFTKKDFDQKMARLTWSLHNDPRMRMAQKQSIYMNYGRTLIPMFVANQVIICESRRLGCATREEILANVDRTIKRVAKANNVPVDRIAQQLPGGLDALRRLAEDEVWHSNYVTNHIKPEKTYDDTIVKAVIDSVAAENKVISESNAVLRARLERIRSEALKPDADFEHLPGTGPGDGDPPCDDVGYWGTFTEFSIEDAYVEPLFKARLAVGEVSHVIEDELGYAIVKVLKEERSDGQLALALARVHIPKHDLVQLANPLGLKQELEETEFRRCIDKRVEELKKTAVITYPHGTNFWKKSKR